MTTILKPTALTLHGEPEEAIVAFHAEMARSGSFGMAIDTALWVFLSALVERGTVVLPDQDRASD